MDCARLVFGCSVRVRGNDGSDSLDSAVAAELLDPSEGGGGRKPETAGELDVRQVAAYLQLGHDHAIKVV